MKILKYLFILTSFMSLVNLANAQEEATLQLGDTIYFDVCNGEQFTYIDYYHKTRFENDTLNLDSLNGWEFYNAFFGKGDFDVSRMPCRLSGKFGIIKHIMRVNIDSPDERTVVIAMIENGVSAAYIIDDAFMTDEVLYIPAK